MSASNRRLPHRVQTAQGQRRHRLHRIGVSLEPETFALLRQRALDLDQPLTWIASDLIELALDILK